MPKKPRTANSSKRLRKDEPLSLKRITEMRDAEERFRLLVEGTPDYAMFLLQPDGTIIYWSSGAEKVFGWRAKEAVGRSAQMIFTPEDRRSGRMMKEISIAHENGVASDRRWHLRKDRRRIWIDGVMRRMDHADGMVRSFAKIGRDATELHEAQEKLEQRVRERTAELQEMNKQLQDEVARRRKLEREILNVTERERARLSQDLHDSLCQELTATAFLLKSRSRAVARESEQAAGSLLEAAETVNNNAGLARDLARGLHPPELGTVGLASALRELAARTNELVRCRCKGPRSLRVPDPDMAVNLYRIAQEAVQNAVKHARPREIVICLERTKTEIVLSVLDDGKGRPRRARAGLGLQMMQYRASVSGGALEMLSSGKGGTKIRVRVPSKP